MGGAMGIGLMMGGLGLASGVLSSERARGAQAAQAAQMAGQAETLRAQGDLEAARAEREGYEIDRRKSKLRAEFEELQGRNRSMLGAGNVDMASGSALDVSYGNIERFAQDMGDNAYERAIRIWEGQAAKASAYQQADNMRAQSTYLQATAGNLGTSLLTGVIQGAGGFASGYSMAGGKLGSLFASSGKGLPAISGQGSVWGNTVKAGAAGRLASGIIKLGG